MTTSCIPTTPPFRTPLPPSPSAGSSHGPHGPTPIGIFRNAPRPVYEDALEAQISSATEAKGPGDLATVLGSNGTWEVG